jgi:hypothetical protein
MVAFGRNLSQGFDLTSNELIVQIDLILERLP